MKFIMGILILFLALLLIETTKASTLKEIHCNGFVRKDSEKIYYKLSGKVIRELKKYYVIDGYSPVYKKNVIHKIKKRSCAKMLSELEPKITKVKKVIEIPPEVEEELIIEPEPSIKTNSLVSSFKEEMRQKERVVKKIKQISEQKLASNRALKRKKMSLRRYFEIILK